MTQYEIKTVLTEEIKRKLLEKGHSISSWARLKGYRVQNVITYIDRYSSKPQLPQSPKIYEILLNIRKSTGVDLTTGRIHSMSIRKST
ncbi:MAG: hypothetical protein AB7E48_00410 [Deferribacterales bacterium]